MVEHPDLEIIDHDFSGDAPEELEGMTVAGEELFHAFGEGKLHVEEAAIAQDHDEETQVPFGGADGDGAEAAPIDLGAFAGSKLQHEEGGFAHRADQTDELLEDAVTAGIALRFDLLEDLLGAVGMTFQEANNL